MLKYISIDECEGIQALSWSKFPQIAKYTHSVFNFLIQNVKEIRVRSFGIAYQDLQLICFSRRIFTLEHSSYKKYKRTYRNTDIFPKKVHDNLLI